MRAAYLLLVSLIAISPALLFVDGLMMHALVVSYGAVALAVIGVSIRPGEAGHLASVIRPTAIVAAIPAIWAMAQMIPLPFKSWAHPIWADAEAALGTSIASGITIDPGATLVAICRYFSAIAILFVATAVTIDRMRAERVLFWLLGATTLAAVVQIVHGLVAFKFLDKATEFAISESTTALCALGVIMAATAAIRSIERYETRRSETDVQFTEFAIILSLALVAFGICALSLAIFSRALVSFAAASGLATFAILMVIRRLGFGLWAGDATAAMAIGLVIAITITIAESHAGSGDVMLRYGSHSQSSLFSTSQRIIADTRWAGTGAGTFALLLPMYGASSTAGMPAPTTAALIAIELGRPALWAIVVMTTAILFLLLRGALQRGRDSFYPAAGASCVVVLTFEAFCDASLFSTTVVICAVAALGLGLAQRFSRMNQMTGDEVGQLVRRLQLFSTASRASR
jgi:hypothetical protein